MNIIYVTFSLFVSAASFLFTIITVYHLGEFLSTLNQQHHIVIYNKLLHSEDVEVWQNVVKPLLRDVGLVALFVVFHSLLARIRTKDFLAKCGITVLYRTLYLSISNVCLQLLITYWSYVTDYTLWAFNTANSDTAWWSFTVIHWLAWIGIYGGCILMDFAELMGIKQVYYYSHGLSDPMLLKNPSLQQLYAHMRHPSFIGILVILWCYPVMTLDRYLLAFLWTVYMAYQFKVDDSDYEYMSYQFRKKHATLSYTAHVTSCQG